jgi:hypothetical protein
MNSLSDTDCFPDTSVWDAGLKTLDIYTSLVSAFMDPMTENFTFYRQSLCSGCQRFLFLFPLSAAPHQIYDLVFAIVSDKASQAAHSICAGLAPGHRTGAHPI